MAKVFIGVGHGGNDPGAVGYLVEKDVNLEMAKACRDYLVKHGVNVMMSRTKDENDRIDEEIRECNTYNPDLAVDVHNNAGGGDGFEVICSVIGTASRKLAENIEKEVKKIGQNSRGIKTRTNDSGSDYFGFIRSTRCPAVICEGVFVDNKVDIRGLNCKLFGEAYAKGILATLGKTENKKTDTKKTENKKTGPYKVKVTANALNIRNGASVDHKIVGCITNKGVYTIVEEKNGWGKLKSGAGWINLKYTKKV